MANQGAKKRKEENKKHMIMLLRLIIASNFTNTEIMISKEKKSTYGCFYITSNNSATLQAIYVLVRMIIFHSTFTWKHWIGLVVTSVAYIVPYRQLANMAKPAFSDDGELLDGGYDMTTDGVCGYLHDVIYITCFVQLMSIISGKFWWTYLVIPAFGAYKVSNLLKGTFFGGSEGDVEDEKSRKKREKMEKKASRGKFIKTRNR